MGRVTYRLHADGAGRQALFVVDADRLVHLRDVERLVIVGGPGTGKSTMARRLGGKVLHTDDLLGTLPWGEQRAPVADWARGRARWVIEGVTAARCLRHGEIEPDAVVWLRGAYAERAPTLARTVEAWLAAWAPTTTVPVMTVRASPPLVTEDAGVPQPLPYPARGGVWTGVSPS